MADNDLNITLGVEEEFFLVDPESRDLIADPDPAIFESCKHASGPHTVVHEFLRSQIETNTRVCANFTDLREARTGSSTTSACAGSKAIAYRTPYVPLPTWSSRKRWTTLNYISI